MQQVGGSPKPTAATGSRTLSVTLGRAEDGSEATWTPAQLNNGHFIYMGASGSGKSVSLRKISRATHDFGVPVLVLDFHNDLKLPGARDIQLSSGSASKVGLNPMELHTGNGEDSGLYDQRIALHELIIQAQPKLGHLQGEVLGRAIHRAYERAGIEDRDPATWSKPALTFANLLQILAEMSEGGQEIRGYAAFG